MIPKGLVFITGAASGIGRALTREFLKEGGRVVAIDHNEDALKDLKKEATLWGFQVETLAADVGDKARFLAALEAACARYGAPSVFVNNAGIARVGGFVEMGLDAFENILRVNFNGVVYGTYFALSKMASGGVVVNISSMAGQLPAGFMAAYTASKFAVVGFSRALQSELEMSHSPARVCLVCPGFIDTAIMKQEGAPFPWFLKWMVDTPSSAAKSIARGVKAGKKEIYPDAGGRLLKWSNRLAPTWTVKSSRVLMARSLSQLLGRTPIRPAAPGPKSA